MKPTEWERMRAHIRWSVTLRGCLLKVLGTHLLTRAESNTSEHTHRRSHKHRGNGFTATPSGVLDLLFTIWQKPSTRHRACVLEKNGSCIDPTQATCKCHTSETAMSRVRKMDVQRKTHTSWTNPACGFTSEWTPSWIQGNENIHSLTYNWTQCIIKLTTWRCSVS